MTTPNSTDPDPSAIIADLHRTRESIAASFGNDLHRLAADARERQRRSGRPVWRQGAKGTGIAANDANAPLAPKR